MMDIIHGAVTIALWLGTGVCAVAYGSENMQCKIGELVHKFFW